MRHGRALGRAERINKRPDGPAMSAQQRHVRRWVLAVVISASALGLGVASPARADSFAIDSSQIPARVDHDRFWAIVGDAAQRWGLGVDGESSGLAGIADGEQVLGFTNTLDPSALGQTDTWYSNVYRVRSYRRCRRRHGRRTCRRYTTRTFRYRQIEEQDVELASSVNWQAGPAYPGPDQYDLQTTLLHELGHVAYPLEDIHVYGCENSPLRDALDVGEWWRAQDDWFRRGCSNSLNPVGLRTVGGRPKHFRAVLHRLPDRVR
jgi:hypothetical protein